MTLEQFKNGLATVTSVNFKLPNGAYVAEHFHITEVGAATKHFVDCGGTERMEKTVCFQLWHANDFDHRLEPQKLLNIISLAEKKLGIGNWDIEVEYQRDTIGKYALHFNGTDFELVPKQTACLATDACGIAPVKQKVQLAALQNIAACGTPDNGCC